VEPCVEAWQNRSPIVTLEGKWAVSMGKAKGKDRKVKRVELKDPEMR
jgi:hypothetical protein